MPVVIVSCENTLQPLLGLQVQNCEKSMKKKEDGAQQEKGTTSEAVKSATTTVVVRGCRAGSKMQAAGLQIAGPQHYQGSGIEVQSSTHPMSWAEKHQVQAQTPVTAMLLFPVPPRQPLAAETNLSIKAVSHRQMFSVQDFQWGKKS